ncbi:hypothetical protein [Microvirga alba]|uniref:hypothetical protein n=1 Tax=Microvirga alba TaxID=2791025 RepID=UPI001E3792DA|nr:hypothetical protein [Microvirga alba]
MIGPEGTASTGSGATGAAAALRNGDPPNREDEEHAPSASAEQSVAVMIQKGVFIIVLIMLGRIQRENAVGRKSFQAQVGIRA